MKPIKVIEHKNINGEYNSLINAIKSWTKTNFYFNNNVVYYIGEGDRVTDLPPQITTKDEFVREKAKFDTALSHIIHTCIIIGKGLQVEDSEKAIQALCSSIADDIDKGDFI